MRLLALLVVCLLAASGSLRAQSPDNPVLAFNLTPVRDWGSAMPFIDHMRFRRDWFGNVDGKWGGAKFEDLRAQGIFDEDGWPTRIPAGIDSIGTIFAWSDTRSDVSLSLYRSRDYFLRYAGQGRISVRGATILSEASNDDGGMIRFSVRDGRNLMVAIDETDPRGIEAYIKDITIVPIELDPYFQAGAIFNPDWIDLVKDARQVRFMDWMETNNAEPADGFTVRKQSVETMVRLANELGAEPWFTMSHVATDAEIHAFADYVAANLDPRLVVHVEFSNEVWNAAFEQSRWARKAAEARGDEGYWTVYVDQAARVAGIWEAAFAAHSPDRLKFVLATQAVNSWITSNMLAYAEAQGVLPHFDELAVTTYFGSGVLEDEVLFAQLKRFALDDDPAGFDWLTSIIGNPDYKRSIQNIGGFLAEQKDLAHRYGLEMVAYEGGQHVFNSFRQGDLTNEQRDQLVNYLGAYTSSPQMAVLYGQLWDMWREVGEGPFMHFSDVTPVARSGAWGLYRNLVDTPPTAGVLLARAEGTTPWWDAQSGPQFENGIYAFASGAELLGTEQEDYLIGTDGNDRFRPLGGADGLNGKSGEDTVIVSGSRADFDVVQAGEAFEMTGTVGRYYLKDIEMVEFDDGVFPIATLVN